MVNSLSNKASVASMQKDLNDFLGKLGRFLKEINIGEDEETNNLVRLIGSIVEACKKIPKFSNCSEPREILAILTNFSGKVLMVFLGMLIEVMAKGVLEPQNKELLKKVMEINNVFCFSK